MPVTFMSLFTCFIGLVCTDSHMVRGLVFFLFFFFLLFVFVLAFVFERKYFLPPILIFGLKTTSRVAKTR